MDPLHSPRNEHSTSEFGKKFPRENSENRKFFPGSKFDPATGVRFV